jgi:hypothetical protein
MKEGSAQGTGMLQGPADMPGQKLYNDLTWGQERAKVRTVCFVKNDVSILWPYRLSNFKWASYFGMTELQMIFDFSCMYASDTVCDCPATLLPSQPSLILLLPDSHLNLLL